MWVFNLLNLFLLHEVVIKLLCMFASHHLVFISLCFLTSWFLNTVRIVFCFYLMKSALCNGRKVVLSFSLINILHLLYLLKFYVLLILPEEQINFKLSNIPGSSVYINAGIIDIYFQDWTDFKVLG